MPEAPDPETSEAAGRSPRDRSWSRWSLPALIPPGRRYDPAPYFVAVKHSATLPVTRATRRRPGT